MADLSYYRNCILQILAEHAENIAAHEEMEAQIIKDWEGDHYQLLHIGWHNQHRIFGVVMHFDIKDGKVWIQWNGTEEEVGDRLLEMGIPKQDIVVGFHPPYLRQFTDYAVG